MHLSIGLVGGCERYIVSYGSLYQCWLTFYFHAALQTKSRTVFECWLTLVINVMVCGAGILRLHFAVILKNERFSSGLGGTNDGEQLTANLNRIILKLFLVFIS